MMAAMEQQETSENAGIPPMDPGVWLAPPQTAHVQVVLDSTGAHGTVVVDGTDLSKRVKAVHLTAEGGKPAQVVLVANSDGFSYEGPGLVKVIEQVATRWEQQADNWLDGLNWREIQVEIAEGSMGQSIADSVYVVLKNKLRGLMRERRA